MIISTAITHSHPSPVTTTHRSFPPSVLINIVVMLFTSNSLHLMFLDKLLYCGYDDVRLAMRQLYIIHLVNILMLMMHMMMMMMMMMMMWCNIRKKTNSPPSRSSL